MRILLVHNFYQERGGEDSVVESEMSLLKGKGHVVELFSMNNAAIAQMSRTSLFKTTLWSSSSAQQIVKSANALKADVVHVHNTFPLISPSIYWALGNIGLPIIQTLHNFRLMCPQAMFLRDGKVCEDCIGRIPWRAVPHRCYRSSAAHSAVLAGMVSTHRMLGTWSHRVTRYIALNDFCRSKFIEGGLPAERISVKPNFVDDPGVADMERDGFLFVGRLSPEKGISVLAEAASSLPKDLRLTVIGTGSEHDKFSGIENVEMLGAVAGDAVMRRMKRSLALVLPSICYENFPRTLVEAYANSLPVIASRHGPMRELVTEGKTGLLFEPGNAEDLAAKIRWAIANPEILSTMGKNARAFYEANFTAEINYRQLMSIYDDAIAEVAEK